MKAELSAKARQRMSVTAARPPVGRQLPLPGRPHDFGTVLAGVEKVMLERPVLSEIVPAVVLQLPTVMPELAIAFLEFIQPAPGGAVRWNGISRQPVATGVLKEIRARICVRIKCRDVEPRRVLRRRFCFC